jgi:hypothetical protein
MSLWAHAILAIKARKPYPTPLAFVPLVSECILTVSGRKSRPFMMKVARLMAFRRIPRMQKTALPVACVSMTVKFLKTESAFVDSDKLKTAESQAGDRMRGICPTIMIPFPPTVWGTLYALEVRAVVIPDMRLPKVLNTVIRIWPYSIMPAGLIVCTVKTTILRPRRFTLKRLLQNNLPVR